MVSTVDVRAAVPPVLVAPGTRRVTIGQPLPVSYHRPGRSPGRIVLVDDRGRVAARAVADRTDGTVTFRTEHLAGGHYAVARSVAASTEFRIAP